jgi:hypothetical protein
MTAIPESHRDLLDAQVGALATIGGDGYPQVTGVWFLLDEDGEIRVSLNETRRKLKNLLERPACTLFILDPSRYAVTLHPVHVHTYG